VEVSLDYWQEMHLPNTADAPLYGMGGAVVGATAPNLVAALAALITKKRTLKEQKEYE